MIKQILALCDYSFFAEAALVMFASIFIIVTLRTLIGNRQESDRHAQIVLTEQPEKLTHE
jgi:hypothetical protein